ncbi:uncharacterized protein LOC126656932 [Mercurialis annua]|uniref:uncharacterized protein LOC126656932 n=1 Tax=Mercurialis annua TaxID=3986 RepID=UPI00216058BF|nr:uncharacterized protein LOC126656932 [Mercurialis annua]
MNHNEESKFDKMLEKVEPFERTQGRLPSTTKTNPREFVKAITFRSNKVFDDPHGKKPIEVNDESSANEASFSKSKASEEVVVEVESPYGPPPPYVPKAPFPSRLKKTPDNQKFHKFLDIFKKLQINISLTDALREMPQYAKFLKVIIMNKRSWDEKGTISLTENYSSIISSKLLTKLQDPGSFTISCSIGISTSLHCLCDLGASINLMPLCLFRNLCGNQSVKETSMMLQLSDHSLKKPHGVVEDVLVKVGKFIFPVDFVVLDYAVDKNCIMILGRPFLNTGRALIDVHARKVTLRMNEESVEFDMRHNDSKREEKKCMWIDSIEPTCHVPIKEVIPLGIRRFKKTLKCLRINQEGTSCQTAQGKTETLGIMEFEAR